MPYQQKERLISIETPLGAEALLLVSLSGIEAVSRMFAFSLELLSENAAVSFEGIVGQRVSIAIHQGSEPARYINGFVSRFSQSGADARFAHYHAEVVPWTWFLTRSADCRIFQNMTVPDIIAQVFKDLGFNDFRNALTGSYAARDYCVQYRETAFNFVSRLMEQYGISYFFEHEKDKHTLVLADAPGAYKPCPGQPRARLDFAGGALLKEDVIQQWHVEQELRTGKYSLKDFNFETPSTDLGVKEPSIVSVDGNSKYEIYDYPGDYQKLAQGETVAKTRMQEEEATQLLAGGAGNCRGFTPGYRFDLQGHTVQGLNKSYVLTEVHHTASVGDSYYHEGGSSDQQHYSNSFSCILASVPYRPARVTPKPFVQGPQTAIVVGKAGEEIWVDKYGRVKVQFHWDRVGKKDENSSCWVRVSQPWAGKNWGAIWIPRMGQEVIVDFLEGDPDQPIVTGRVYNAEQMPPYTLPDNQTRSTFKSRSSKGGTSSNYNELRFEDKKGSEQLFINAEKDMDLRVENDSREYVGNDRHLIVNANQLEQVNSNRDEQVSGNHTEKIGGDFALQIGGNQSEQVGGNQSFTVGGNRTESVGGSESVQVGADRKEQVGGSVSLQVGASRNEKIGATHAMEAGQTIHLKGGMTVIIEAGMQLSLKVGGNFIDIGPAGVSIQGTMVMINSGGAAGSGPGASPDSPSSPATPADPKTPDTADDGSKGGKLNED